ncbi:MAG: hypothetical protein JST28_02660 [Acidobacteria bacterium]|nr:hypothetical protein [Acidobacteriota bacterium]
MFSDRNDKHSGLMDQTNKVGLDFLRTDLEAALTFIKVAQTTSSSESRSRNFGKALEVHRTVLHFLPRLFPSPEELKEIDSKLEQIKLKLEQAGFPVGT